MMLIFFLNGLAFFGLGLAAYLQFRQGSDLPLNRHLIWLALFGFLCGATSWLDMFMASDNMQAYQTVMVITRMVTQSLTGMLLLKFGWDILRDIPLPAWTFFVPGVMIVPIAYMITYAATTFITPSPLEIPIDIWSRYLLYLPGAIMSGIGFIRQGLAQRKQGHADVTNLLFGAGIAFLFEAIIVGLVVPAAPTGPTSYYNYDRVFYNAFLGENSALYMFSGFTTWLDYQQVLKLTGLPIQFWRAISAFTVTFFVVRGLGVFDAVRKRQLKELQEQRDRAQKESFETQLNARQAAERWTDALMTINRQIMEMQEMDQILLYIVKAARELLHANFIGLALLADDPTSLELKYYSIRSTTRLVEENLAVRSPILVEALGSSPSYASTGQEPPARVEKLTCGLEKRAKAFGIVRLELDDRPIGLLWATRTENLALSETEMIWLECMADQVVIAIQHGLMTSQLQSLSITEERARIARDMHDGLAQVLGYLNLEVQTLAALHKQGKGEDLSLEMDKMRKAIQTANADVRENILSLRTTLSTGKGLVSAIGEYLEEFGIQTGIETHLSNALTVEIKISSLAEVQLVCILQEALTNVRKHARARRVTVELASDEEEGREYMVMQVHDDGIGLKEKPAKHSFGLKTMQERANSVGGHLALTSTPGGGTTVICRLACLESGKVKTKHVLLPPKNTHLSHDMGSHS